MTRKLDSKNRSILEFRPNIDFVEPEVQPGEIIPIEEPPQLEDLLKKEQQVRQLANAVNVLAAAVQAKVDGKAKNIAMVVDPIVDNAVLQAMRRRFPGADPSKVTYGQYKDCKEDLRKMGEEIGKKALISPDEIETAKNDPSLAQKMGGFGTPESTDGRLRPELQKRGQVVEPIDMQKLQMNLICLLANFVWKNFILIAFKPVGIPGLGSLADALPQELCDPGEGLKIPDLFILGGEVPSILKGKAADKKSEKAPER